MRVIPLFAVVILLAGCHRSPEGYFAKGREQFSKQQFADAALSYRKAIQGDSGFAEAFYQLGLTEIRLNQPREAFQHLSRAADLAPGRPDLILALGDFSLRAYLDEPARPKALYDTVAKLADRLQAKDPQSYDALRWKANLASADRKLDEAEELFRRANEVKPDQPEVILGWSHVLFQKNQPTEAERLARRLIGMNKTFGPIYDELFVQYTILKKKEEAEAILKERVSNNPDDAQGALELAAFYATPAREADMKAVLQRMLSNPAAFPLAYVQVGDLYNEKRRWDDAIRIYRQGAQANPKEKIVYLKRISGVWLAQGKGEQAMAVVSEIRKQDPSDDGAKAVEASILINSRNPQKAAEAAAIFRELVKKSPDNVTWRFNLGRALAAQGDLAGAKREYDEAARATRNFLAPRLALVQLSQSTGDYRSALGYANDILAIDQNMPLIKLVRAQCLVATGSLDQGRQELKALDQTFPDEVQLQLAIVDLGQQKFKDAQDKFQKLLEKNHGDPRALNGLVQTVAAQNQIEKALQLVRQELERSPGSEPIRLLFADVEMAAGRIDLAIEQYKQLLVANPRSAQHHLSLGRAYELKRDAAKAIVELRESVRLAPNDPLPLAYLAHVLIDSGHRPEALGLLSRALSLRPGNASLMNDLAYLIAETGGNLDEALKLAEKAFRASPSNPEMADTLAWIYTKKNLSGQALPLFRNLVDKQPEKVSFRYHFGVALAQSGNRAAAQQEFDMALSMAVDPEMRREIESARLASPIAP